MSDDDDDRPLRRRTSFEKDLRELILKLFLGTILGVGLHVFSGWGNQGVSVWVSLFIGWLAVFWLAKAIRNDGRFSD